MGSKSDKNRIVELAARWHEGVITAEDKVELELWYNSFNDSDEELQPTEYVIKERIFDRIERNIHPQKGFLKTKQTKL